MSTVRPPAVAGMFYPAEAQRLAHDVQQFLAEARPFELIESADRAACRIYLFRRDPGHGLYAMLQPVASHIRRVVLLGPTHRVAVRGARRCPAWMRSIPLWAA